MSKNLDETVCLLSEIRREWIREIREERLQGIAEGASSTPRLASSSAALLPRRNKCPGQETNKKSTRNNNKSNKKHYNLMEQKERENSSCQRLR